MTNEATVSAFQPNSTQPAVRKIQFSDLAKAMKGLTTSRCRAISCCSS
jgi:hypothetical protein